ESLSLRQLPPSSLFLLKALVFKGFRPKICYKFCYKTAGFWAMKHVNFIRGKYVARMTVPEDLREIVGKRELVEPLGGDKKASERRALAVLNGFHGILDDAREALEANRPTLSTAAKQHYRESLDLDDRARRSPIDLDTRDFTRWSRAIYASRLRLLVAGEVPADEAEALIGYAADDLLRKGVAPDVPRRELLSALAEAQLDALARFEERDNGQIITGTPTSPLLTEPDPKPKKLQPDTTGSGSTLNEVLKAFHNERNAGGASLAKATMNEHETGIRMFNEFMGRDVPVNAITRKDVIAYKQALLEMPTRAHARFPGLTLPQAIKANKKRAHPYATMAPKTINVKWLSHLSSVLKWSLGNGYIDVNPAQGIRVDMGNAIHQQESRLPFDRADLKRMFGHPMFADPATYGTEQWAVLLALYTGARGSTEIATLRLDDVKEEQGEPVFYLSGASKNRHSKRLVPIHADLIKLGIHAYADRLRARGETMLFPEWTPKDKVNRWFLRTFLPEIGIDDKRKVFHSFRHTLKTELVRSGCSMEISNLITGHKDQSVAAIYVHDAPIRRMKRALDKVHFDLPMWSLAD
ncbi:MAG: site-specific integrase, partial [Roseivivax sp.]|nr:site-specific integrase [Roseivivax sp.]